MISVLHLSSSDLLIFFNNYSLFNHRAYSSSRLQFILIHPILCFFFFIIIHLALSIPIFSSPIRYTLCVSIYCFAFTIYRTFKFLFSLVRVRVCSSGRTHPAMHFPANFVVNSIEIFPTLREKWKFECLKMSLSVSWKINWKEFLIILHIHLPSECCSRLFFF